MRVAQPELFTHSTREHQPEQRRPHLEFDSVPGHRGLHIQAQLALQHLEKQFYLPAKPIEL